LPTTATDEELVVEVSKPAIRDGSVVLNVTKVWGSLDARHRGSTFMGGMTWVPDGAVPVTFGTGIGEALSAEECADMFREVISTLMPGLAVFVASVDDVESDF